MRPAPAQPTSHSAVLDALRAEAGVVTARVFAALTEAGEGAASIAARLDVRVQRVSALCAPALDRRTDQRLRIHEAAALPLDAAREIAQFVVGPTHVVVPLPALDRAQGDHAALSDAMREAGEAFAAHARAIASGSTRVARGEVATEARREIREAIVALMRLDACLELGEREGVTSTEAQTPRPLRAVGFDRGGRR